MNKKQIISELEILKKKVENQMDDMLCAYLGYEDMYDEAKNKFNKLNSSFNNYIDIIKRVKSEKYNYDYEFDYGTGEEPIGLNMKYKK